MAVDASSTTNSDSQSSPDGTVPVAISASIECLKANIDRAIGDQDWKSADALHDALIGLEVAS